MTHDNSNARAYLFEDSFLLRVSVVSEIMPQKIVVTVDIKDNPTALEVSKLMAKHRIGSIIVVEGKNKTPVGIVTERDIISKVSAQNKNADQVAVGQIMSSPLVTVKSFDSIDTAAETIVENKVKRLVVLEQDGTMVGILSVTDIARKLAKILTEDYSRYQSLRNLLDMD
jgi:CBS domain-containing protein